MSGIASVDAGMNVGEELARAEQLLAGGQKADAKRLLERIMLAHPKEGRARELMIAHQLAPAWKLREWQEQDQYHYFVDDSIREYHGAAAKQKLAEKNDAKFLTEEGILQVDAARWQEAQRYEKKTWMEQNLGAVDDRNEFHKQQFGGYEVIAGKGFENVIELGCGPFTNLRLILPLVKASGRVDLLDPLIESYLTHPHCTYPKYQLCGREVGVVASAIENFVPTAKYGMVVMVNVLEHCFDIPKIFENIAGMLKPGGVFVFADVTTTAEALRATKTYDAGHPIRMIDSYLTGVLERDYEKMYLNSFRDVTHLQHRDICHYFIGRRKG